jgi:hypothetical protein
MKSAQQYEILVIGLGNAGTMIVEEVSRRRKLESIRYVIVSSKIDDLRKSAVKEKVLLNEELDLKPVIKLMKKIPTVIIIGEVTSAVLWIKLLQHKVIKQSKKIYSFVIPALHQSKLESDRHHKQIVDLSTRTLYVPVDLFKLYSRYSGNVAFKELEDLARHFTKIAVNSFLFIYEQFILLSSEESSGIVKNLLGQRGKMYFSLGSDSADSVREAYHSPLISEDNIKSSRLKLLHVQFKKPISLMTAHMLGKWVDKYKVDIRIDSILMERNPKIEDVALTRLWLFD